MAPMHPAFVLGLPIGIWALVILLRQETREAFRLREQHGPIVQQIGSTLNEFAQSFPAKPPRDYDAPGAAALRIPALGLMIIGVVGGVGSILIILRGLHAAGPAFLPVVILLLTTATGLFLVKGGWHMLNQRSYTAAILGVVAALLPVSPLWLISMPLGIWALILLQRDEVKGQFEDRSIAGYSSPATGQTTGHASLAPVITAVALLLVVSFVACAMLITFLRFLAPVRQHTPEAHTIVAPATPDSPAAPADPPPPPRTLILPEAPATPTMEIRRSVESEAPTRHSETPSRQ
jgi:hypothetical protein